MTSPPTDVGTEHGTRELCRLTERVRRDVAAAIARAAEQVGRLVADAELYFEDAVDQLEQLAVELGIPDAAALVLGAVWRGMGHPDEVTEGLSGELTDAPAPPEPPAPSEATEGPFSDWDEISAAVLGWAGRWLVAAPGAQVSSADLATHWSTHVGRPLTGFYRHASDAVQVWAEASGIEVSRYRTRTARGLVGLALVTPDEPPAVDVTRSEPEAVTPTDEAAVAVTQPVAEVRRRPPNGGTWQSFADLGDAAAEAAGWFDA